MNYFGSIDLLKLNNAVKSEKDGKVYVVIPVHDNPSIVMGDKGAFLSINVQESKNTTYGSSHFIKASVKKEVRESLPGDMLYKVTPIIGNLKESGGYQTKPVPTPPAFAPNGQPMNDANMDDLPDFLKD